MKLSKAQTSAMHLIRMKLKTSATFHDGAWWADMGQLVRLNTLRSLERKGLISLKSFQVDTYEWINAGFCGERKTRIRKTRNWVKLQEDK